MDRTLMQLHDELSRLEPLGFTEKGVAQINRTVEKYENLPEDNLEEAKIYFPPYLQVLEELALKRLNTSAGTIETSISITSTKTVLSHPLGQGSTSPLSVGRPHLSAG